MPTGCHLTSICAFSFFYLILVSFDSLASIVQAPVYHGCVAIIILIPIPHLQVPGFVILVVYQLRCGSRTAEVMIAAAVHQQNRS